MAHLYRFDAFELDTERGALLRRDNGAPVHVPPQPFRALEHLVERRGHLVSREALARALWPDEVHVDQDLGLNHCIRRLRQVLDDDSRRPRCIETVPRRGFRFVAEVEVAAEVETAKEVSERRTVDEGAGQRVAILPFASHSPHLVEIRFGDGLAEEVLREAFRMNPFGHEILALHRIADDHWSPATETPRPDWVLTGSARYDSGVLRVLAYTIRASDGAVLRTGEWQDETERVDLDVQRRAAQALVESLLPAPRSAHAGVVDEVSSARHETSGAQ